MSRVKRGNLLKWAIAGLALVALAILPLANSAFADGHEHEHEGRFGKHTLHGRYLTSYHGFDASNNNQPYSVSGVLMSDGAGNVNGVQNINYGGASFQCTFTGTYTVSNTPVNGSVTLNIAQQTCKQLDCNGATGAPDCSANGTASPTASQWFCSLAAPSGKSMVCTEMGEVPGGTTTANEAPISALTWSRRGD